MRLLRRDINGLVEAALEELELVTLLSSEYKNMEMLGTQHTKRTNVLIYLVITIGRSYIFKDT